MSLASLDLLLAELETLEVWIAKTAAATLLSDGRTLGEALAAQRRLRLRLAVLRRLRRRLPDGGRGAIAETLREGARLRRLIRAAAGQVDLAHYSFIPTFLQAVTP